MKREVRKKAYRALLTAQAQGGKHFPRVWVCGDHVYFSASAAYLQQREYAFLEGRQVPIEEVKYQDACENDVADHKNWRDEVDWAIETAQFSERTAQPLVVKSSRNSASDPMNGKKEPKPKSKVADVIGSVFNHKNKK